MAWHHFIPPMGERYIFFSSLEDPQYYGKRGDDLDSETAFRYSGNPTIASLATSYFSQSYFSDVTSSATIVTDFNNFITTYTQMLEQLAQNERAAETAYLEHIKNKFQTIDKKNLPIATQEQIEKFLKVMPKENASTWDYPTIISAFTLMRSDSEKILSDVQKMYTFLKEQQEQQIDINIPRTIKVTKENAKKKNDTEPITRSLKEFFLTNYKQYVQAYREAGGKLITDTCAHTIANDISTALTELTKNPIILNTIADELSSHGISTPKKQAEIIKNILAKLAYENSEALKNITNPEKLQKNVDFSKLLSNLPDVSSVFNIKKDSATLQSIEEFALTHYDGIANRFIEIWLSNPQSTPNQYNAIQLELLKNFDIDGTDKISKNARSAIKAIITALKNGKNQVRAKATLTSILRKRLAAKVTQTSDDLFTKLQGTLDKDLVHDQNWQKDQQKILDDIFQAISIKPTYVTDALLKNLKVTTIKAADTAEIIAAAGVELQEQLQQGILQNTYIPGKAINLKQDVTFTVSFSPIDISEYLLDTSGLKGYQNKIKNNDFTKAMQELTTTIEDFSRKFLTQYKIKLQQQDNSTDIQAAYDIYMENMKDLREKYFEAVGAMSELYSNTSELIKFLNDTFLGGISVKQYEAYQQGLGFHGGSLGGQHNVVDGVEQIAKMYELGGITLPDTEFIINAILNCMSDGWIDSDFIDVIKDMLIGGALMMMFDDGFANTQKVLKKVQTMFGGAAPKTVHLYQFQTLYVPASYLLTNICEGLKLYQQDITQTFTEPKYTAASIEIYNDMSNEDIPIPQKGSKKSKWYNGKNRWNEVRDIANKKVKMYILLMGGLLDLFEKLPEYMTSAI